ncbi:MAG: phosphoglucomutase/phosphomannomutase family protein [Candidatus Marsarchaeota archaeon]|nr:phosphoglucomutase/phosphomannomutase family protein [Candidatus Marsarchaeota archaeon]
MISFGTDGWRSRMDDDFDEGNVYLVASAAARYIIEEGMGERGVIVGHDARHNSRKFAGVAARAFANGGIKPYIVDKETPTPAIAFAVVDRKLGGGVQITASHNPPVYNGFKFIPHYGGPAFPQITSRIEKSINEGYRVPERKAPPEVGTIDMKPSYIGFIEKSLQLGKVKGLSIVTDPLFGAGVGYMAEILRRNGAAVEEIHGNPDPEFGGLSPDPTPENLKGLKEKVVDSGADMGLANDGDADRIAAVDEKGGFYTSIELSLLIADYLFGRKGTKGKIARTVASTHTLDRLAEKYSVEVVETPVGFKYIAKELMGGAAFGADGYGGLGYGWGAPEKDGILSGVLLAEMRGSYGKPLSEIWEEVSSRHGFGGFVNRNYKVDSESSAMVKKCLERPPGNIGGRKVVETSRIDGIRLSLDDGSWVLMRASGTEPLIRIYAESSSEKEAEELAGEFARLATGG